MWWATLVLGLACATGAPPAAPPQAPPARRPGGPGTISAPARATSAGPTLLPAQAARKLLLTDPSRDPHRPRLPPSLEVGGARYVGLYRICVSSAGLVDSVKVNKSTGDPALDRQWMDTIRTWHYRPLELAGKRTPFCTVSTLEVTAP